MAGIVWADVTALASELESVSDTMRVFILQFVNTKGVDPAQFDGENGPTTRLARIYLAAHFGAGVGQGASGAAGGPVTSESAGGLSRSYSVSSVATSADNTASTDYGRRYEALVRNSLGRIGFVVP